MGASSLLVSWSCSLPKPATPGCSTRPSQRIVAELESSVLSKVPAYEYLKQASASVLGLGEMAEHPVVLAKVGGAWRIGVQTDIAEGGLVAVFVPNSPNSFSGAVFFVASDQVMPSGIPLAAALNCLRRCGGGSNALLSGLFAGARMP